ncbi:MAG: hypothetical protein GYA21_09720 [Myxococcales bacterium]|nr:hypothetical protein [Myxococcales bacterium]
MTRYTLQLVAGDLTLEGLRNDIGEFLSLPSDGDFRVEIVLAHADKCAECYRLIPARPDDSGLAIRVEGGGPLGLQYGVYHALELMGWRFFTPYQGFQPERIDPDRLYQQLVEASHEENAPEMALRGLHLHTLHTIEGLFDFWLAQDPERARRVVDWVIQNRGNYLQWVALDDILDGARAAAWKTFNSEVLAYAHRRGVQVGLNTLVFAASSLQHAYLTDSFESLRFLQDLPFDWLNLSFGEFVGEDPQFFVDRLGEVVEWTRQIRPECRLSATVHVGNFDNLRVEYQGQRMQYYFLVQFVPAIVPWIHSVMYYNLYEDAGGAYRHDEFDEHRDFLLGRLRDRQAVGYFPESAYWIAFDNSVPVYLPLYIRSRWLDLAQTRQRASAQGGDLLSQHVLFSSGWEWGYWQTDALTLRMNHHLADDWRDDVRWLFSPLPNGARLSERVVALAEAQHRYLIERRLAAYFAGVDFWVEAGHYSGIISQPYRILVKEAAGLTGAEKDDFVERVIEPMELFADELDALTGAAGEAARTRWEQEVEDGIAIDALRARFASSVYRAALERDEDALRHAQSLMEQAREVVRRRHADLAYPEPERLLSPGVNPTIYPFGYLRQADILCLWERELIEARNAIFVSNEAVPWCIE